MRRPVRRRHGLVAATLPVQAANYCYRSGGGGDCWTQR